MTFQSIMSTSNDYIVYWRVTSAPSLCDFFSVAKQKYLFHIPTPCSQNPPNYDLDESILGPFCIFFLIFVKICVHFFPFILPLCIYISSSEVTKVSIGHP